MKKVLCALLALTILMGCTTAFAGETYEYAAYKDGVECDQTKMSKPVHLLVDVKETYEWEIPAAVDFTEPETPAEMDDLVIFKSTVPNTKYINIYVHTNNEFKLVYESNSDPETGALPDGVDFPTYLDEDKVVTSDTARYALYELWTPIYDAEDKVSNKLINKFPTVEKEFGNPIAKITLRQLLQITGQQGKVKEESAAASDARVPMQSIITDASKAEENGYYSDILTFYGEVVKIPEP